MRTRLAAGCSNVGRSDIRLDLAVRVGSVDRERHDFETQARRGCRDRAPGCRGDVHRGAIGEGGCEEARLGRDVRVDRAVVVEMILREVREAGDGETGAVDAVLIERVRRHLHRDGLDACVAHPRQERLQLGGLGCRLPEALGALGVTGLDGTDHAGAATGRDRDRLEEVARRGLAVGAGHAEHRHASRRMAEQARRERADGRAHRRDAYLGAADVDEVLDEKRGRARTLGYERVVVTIGRLARDAAEQGALVDQTAVVHDGTNLECRIAAELDHVGSSEGVALEGADLEVKAFEEVVQQHGSS